MRIQCNHLYIHTQSGSAGPQSTSLKYCTEVVAVVTHSQCTCTYDSCRLATIDMASVASPVEHMASGTDIAGLGYSVCAIVDPMYVTNMMRHISRPRYLCHNLVFRFQSARKI